MTGPRPRPGFTLVETLVVIAILGVLAGLVLAAVQKVREAAARADCQNRPRQSALALHQYHDGNRKLPPGVMFQLGTGTMPAAGWGVFVLPFVEQGPVHQQAVADYQANPLFSLPPVHRGLSAVVSTYVCPADPRTLAARLSPKDNLTVAFTSYLGVCGRDCSSANDGVLYRNSATAFADITDGLSNTLLLGERPPSPDFHLGWWYAGLGQISAATGQATGSAEMILGAAEANVEVIPAGAPCGPGVYPYRPGRFDDPCAVYHFWSPHPGGANFATADGGVRLVRYDAAAVLPALATRAGNEAVALD